VGDERVLQMDGFRPQPQQGLSGSLSVDVDAHLDKYRNGGGD
jgi:hypothetical protein